MLKIDLTEPSTFYRVGIYGDPGTGKTTIATSAPDVLHLLTERNGVAHIRRAQAQMGRRVRGVILIEKFNDLRVVLAALIRSDRSKPLVIPGADGPAYEGPWPKSVAIDHLTDVARLLTEEIREQVRSKGGELKTDREGLPKEADGYWRVFIDRMIKLITSFRDLPMHVIFLAHAKEEKKTTGAGKNRETIVKTRPALPSDDVQRVFVGSVNVVGVTFRRIENGKPRWGIATLTSDLVVSKPLPPLRAQETPDLSDWFRRLDEDGRSTTHATAVEGEILDAQLYDESPVSDDGPTPPRFGDDGSDDAGAEEFFRGTKSTTSDAPQRAQNSGDARASEPHDDDASEDGDWGGWK